MPQLKPKNAKPATRSMGRRKVKKYPPLTEEQKLLVEEHRWIAGRLAYRARCLTNGFTGMFTKEDLESVACFAICVAATRFSSDRGVKFSTYAWATAHGYILHALRDHSRMVRLPRWINDYRTRLREMLGEGFSYDEACDALGIDSEKAFLCEMSWKEIHASFDYKPEDWREREFVYNDDEIKALLISDDIKDALISLDDKEIKLLLAYVDDQPLSEAEIEVAEKKLSVLREIARA